MNDKTENFLEDGWTEKDLPEMLLIWNQIVAAGDAFPQEEELDEETGLAFFKSQSHCGVTRDAAGSVKGLYILHPNNIGRCGHICNASYAVSKDYRGKGLGERLVKNSLLAASRLGFRIIQFNAVVASNSVARKLYKKLGFTELGVIPGGFHDKDGVFQDIVLYWRKL